MSQEMKKQRDIMDLSSPDEGATTERPVVAPDTGRFFLDKFLSEKNEAEAAPADTPKVEKVDLPDAKDAAELQEQIVGQIMEIFDPEIPVNIYDLGLIYAVDVTDSFDVTIKMTLTTPHCPVAESMPGDVEMKVRGVPSVRNVEVQLVWEPPWDMSLMTDEARLELGLL